MAPVLATSALTTGVFSVWSGMMTRNAFAFADKNIDTKEEHWGYVYDPKWIALDIVTAGTARLLFNRLLYGKPNPSAADLDWNNGPRALPPAGKKPGAKPPLAGKKPGAKKPSSGKNGTCSTPKSGTGNKAGTTGGKGAGNNTDEYLSSKAPNQVTPGTRVLEGQYVNDLGQVQPWKAYYDQYGRLIARTDFNAGNTAAGIPDTHYHLYEWGPGKNPLEYESHIEGEYRP